MEEPKPKKLYIDSKDRISILPEDILHHILYHFDLKSAAKTCVLSKAWRHVWCTRPRLVFILDRTLVPYVVDTILQSYHNQNLRLEEFALWTDDDIEVNLLLHKWIPVIIHDMGVKRFHLSSFNCPERSKPSPRIIQLPSTIYESHINNNIQDLFLERCIFDWKKTTTSTRVCLKRLQTLWLNDVYIPEGLLDSILSNCTFLENVSLSGCEGFTAIKIVSNKNNRLEELKLDRCSSIKEFNLSSRSMKRLSIHNVSRTFKAAIDAPSIVSFHYEGILPQSISFSGSTYSDDHLWKSKIDLGSSFYCFSELYGLLKAVSQSEISLELDRIEIRRLWRQISVQQLPLVVEHLWIKRREENRQISSAAPFLKRLFRMFRPSFMYIGTSFLTNSKLRHCEIAGLLFKGRKTRQRYFWQRVLEGVSLQVKYRNRSEWQPVEHTSFTQVIKKAAEGELELRIQFKWTE